MKVGAGVRGTGRLRYTECACSMTLWHTTEWCTTYVVFCSSFPHRTQQTNVTFLPGHVIITDVSASGATETIVTLYIALPLNATPLDSENPTIPGDVTAIIVQAAESSIEAALGLQVCR